MITIKSEREIELMRRAGMITATALFEAGEAVRPGVTTQELDKIARNVIEKMGAKPSFLGYGGFPKSICTSVNDVVIHGIPSEKQVLKEGDIISIDVGAYIEGFHGDCANTFPVGEVSPEAEKLIRVTRESFFEGVKFAKQGNRLSDISHAVQSYVESFGYGVIRKFVGHGIGREMHEDPQIPNYGNPGRGPRLTKGMVLAIEPMVSEGSYDVSISKDGWTVTTIDHKLSAHYENTIAILEDGFEILTLPQGGK